MLVLLFLSILSACAKRDIPVSIHGVNYSGEIFRYFIEDPKNKKNSGGGETIDPYGAGGTMCCFSLPKKWRPGIKVEIHATHWLANKVDDKLQEISETKIVEVPVYAHGEPGELWVLRGKHGDLSVISTDYQPDHSRWPSKIKGWPIPSVEYRRERWQIYMKHEQDGVRLYQDLLVEIENSPEKTAQDAWNVAKETDKESLVKFSGPNDIFYRKYLKEGYKEGLERSKKNVEKLRRERP